MSQPEEIPSRQSQQPVDDQHTAHGAAINDPEAVSDADSVAGDEWADAVDEKTQRKRQEIIEACQDADIGRLRALAQESGGFLDDNVRCQAWPILLGTPESHNKDNWWTVDWQTLPVHKDEDQVALDVKRAFIYYPRNRPEDEVKRRKEELSDLIIEILRRHPYLSYFQGYHDICQVLLLVLEPTWRPRLLARLSLLRIRDFMLPNLAPTVSQLNILPEIIERADPELRCHVAGIEPFYALAGTLTMYAHNIQDYQDIARLFDVLLGREPVFSIYLFAQIVLDRRVELLETPSDDTAMLHFILSKAPANIDLDTLIDDSVVLFGRYRPETLRSWKTISQFSVVKTANPVDQSTIQTLEDGHAFFQSHASELRWAEARAKATRAIWRYRRPIQLTGSTVGVVLLAMYLRRNQGLVNHFMMVLAQYLRWQ